MSYGEYDAQRVEHAVREGRRAAMEHDRANRRAVRRDRDHDGGISEVEVAGSPDSAVRVDEHPAPVHVREGLKDQVVVGVLSEVAHLDRDSVYTRGEGRNE